MGSQQECRRTLSTFISFFLVSFVCLGSGGFGALSIDPVEDYSVSGPEGGPFEPGEKIYTLTNTGTSSISWGVVESPIWLDFDLDWGLLDPNEIVDVTVSVNAIAESLAAGEYNRGYCIYGHHK